MKYLLFTLFVLSFFGANAQVFSAFQAPLNPFFPFAPPNFNSLEDGIHPSNFERPSLMLSSGLGLQSPNLPYQAADLRFRLSKAPFRLGVFREGIPQFRSIGGIIGTGFSGGPEFFGAIDYSYRNLGIPEYELAHFHLIRLSWIWKPKIPFYFRCQTALEAAPNAKRNFLVQAALNYAISPNHSLGVGFRNYSADLSPQTSLQFSGISSQQLQYVFSVPLHQTGISAGFALPLKEMKLGFSAEWTSWRGSYLHVQLLLPLKGLDS